MTVLKVNAEFDGLVGVGRKVYVVFPSDLVAQRIAGDGFGGGDKTVLMVKKIDADVSVDAVCVDEELVSREAEEFGGDGNGLLSGVEGDHAVEAHRGASDGSSVDVFSSTVGLASLGFVTE